jgi:hypothetical protein
LASKAEAISKFSAAADDTPPAKTGPSSKSKKTAKRNPDQREMLLPIAGSGPAREVPEPLQKPGEEKPRARQKAG